METFDWFMDRVSGEERSLEEVVKTLMTERIMNRVSALMGKVPGKGVFDKVPGKDFMVKQVVRAAVDRFWAKNQEKLESKLEELE